MIRVDLVQGDWRSSGRYFRSFSFSFFLFFWGGSVGVGGEEERDLDGCEEEEENKGIVVCLFFFFLQRSMWKYIGWIVSLSHWDRGQIDWN